MTGKKGPNQKEDAVIICPKCQTQNSSGDKICQKCGRDLLPGETIKERFGTLIIGIIACIIAGLIAFFLIQNPDFADSNEVCLLTNPSAWMFASAFSLITAFVSAVRKTPEFRKYENRAKRHLEQFPDQSVNDYSKAIELAPDKEKAPLVKSRSELYKKLGKEEESIKDQLEYMATEGAYDDAASFVTMLGGDKDTYVDQTITSERKRLIADGKIKGVAFCDKCQRAVELDEKLKCPLHPKVKLINSTFIMPDELDETLESVEKSSSEQLKRTKRRRLIVFIIVGVVILMCVVIPLITSLLLE